MRSLDKKQPAEDNLSLEPWVLGGRVDLLDGGRGHVCMHLPLCVAFSFVAVCRFIFYTPVTTQVTAHSHTRVQTFAFLRSGERDSVGLSLSRGSRYNLPYKAYVSREIREARTLHTRTDTHDTPTRVRAAGE